MQAGELSEFALNSCLDAAVRASNAQYDAPDVLERLRVRLPRGSAFETGAPLTKPQAFDILAVAF